ncbi:hypothetical protein I4U23_015650 [Adineta vaga]|nr:hypothetical protein I4U23_015650 [Adineta vaga]
MLSKTTFESLPNDIFIESFRYLNAPDIFHSFDQVNYRFHSLLRNCSLHLNFHEFKKFKFNEFCQTLLSQPELKQNIISLQLSNKPTYGQIKSFLSLFSLNGFIGLRSLSLIDIQGDSIRQLFPTLPFLSNLYQPS